MCKKSSVGRILSRFIFTVLLMSGTLFCGALVASELTGVKQISLIADVDQVEVGGSLTLGVHFKLYPGWHLYWKNPGEYGVAPEVDFKVPSEFVVGTLRWPTPVKFEQRKDVVGYGYANEVILSARAKSDPSQVEGRRVTFKAEVRWLACSTKRCVPGSASVKVPIDVRTSRHEANQKLFSRLEKQLPLEQDKHAGVVTVLSKGALRSLGGIGVFDLTYEWENPVTVIEWLPAEFNGLSMDLLNLDSKPKEGITRVRFRAMAAPGAVLPENTVETVLSFKDSSGLRRGISFNVPLGKK